MRQVLGERCPFPRLSSKVRVAKGDNLYHQGDRVRGAFSLSSGMVALERVGEDGDLVILKVLQAGAFFPCADLMHDGLHTTTARALTDITACFVPSDRLKSAIKDDHALTLALLKLNSVETRENEEAIFNLCSVELPDRVLAVLTTLAIEIGHRDANGDLRVTLPMAWRDLAAMVGTGPEVISRQLRRLASAGRLSFKQRHVVLHAPHAPKATRTR
ncbi:cAMP-binding protein [Candidatus Terasakiella magnetica]|nr:cAMP-binding protein [Candidatus Terasakiella magnetica]